MSLFMPFEYRISRAFTFLLFLFSTLAFQNALAVEKSPNDPKAYEAFVLDNALEVLIISDPDSDKAAAAMNVAVGSNANPKDRAGLAHFLEHMLFLGTEKYPAADEYQHFISTHGGSHNAFTAQENTNYFFDVSAPNLEPALDRFAQFFIAPKFDEKYVDRERHAVHSEYQAKIKDDYRRGYAAAKQAMNPEHSHNQFSVGSLTTLADRPDSKIRDELIQFYERYYSANLMSLVVLGKEPLPELKAMVIEKFSAVKNRNATEFKETKPLFKKGQLPQQLFVEPVKDIRSLTLTFPTPAFQKYWQKKPLHYISSLIGYEGEGSLLSHLKQQGLASGLSASPGHNLPTEGTFFVSIQLTQKGLDNYLDVANAFFQYVELMKKEGLKPSLYDEEKRLVNIQFRFQEQSEPIHLVSGLASQMQYYPTRKAISANYLFEGFDEKLIRLFLEPIRPDNMFLTLTAKGLPTDQKESYYSTPYKVTALNSTDLKALTPTAVAKDLAIRALNPYIAEDLSLISTAASSDKPQLIKSQQGFELWYQQDTEFKTPKANIYFTLQSDLANDTAQHSVLNDLFTRMIQEQLNETLYDAYLAGMGTEIYPHMRGLSVRLSGYNDKLPLLLDKVVAAFKEPEWNETRFKILKRQHVEALQNSFNDKPYNQTSGKLYQVLLPRYERQTELDAAKAITLKDLQDFADAFLAAPNIKVLVHGNLLKGDAENAGKTVAKALLADKVTEAAPINVRILPQNEHITEVLDIDHTDAAISILYQAADDSPASRAELSVLGEILSSPFYNELRTEKQLGYIVFATPVQMNKTPNLAFIVQSPNTDADTLERNISEFTQTWLDKLSAISDKELTRYKQSVLSRINQKDNQLSTRTQRYWRELDWQELNFDTQAQLSSAVEKLTLADLKESYKALLTRQLTVKSYGTKLKPKEIEVANESEGLPDDIKPAQPTPETSNSEASNSEASTSEATSSEPDQSAG